MDSATNDNEPLAMKLITGRIHRDAGRALAVQIMLTAPDDDTAVRRALEALQQNGYARAELDRIGELEEEPDDEPQRSAFQDALEGVVSIVTLGTDP